MICKKKKLSLTSKFPALGRASVLRKQSHPDQKIPSAPVTSERFLYYIPGHREVEKS